MGCNAQIKREGGLNKMEQDLNEVIELLEEAMGKFGANEMQTPIDPLKVIDAAWILCKCIKVNRMMEKHAEEWQIAWFLFEAECTPRTMEEYAAETIRRTLDKQKFIEAMQSM
jgi:hypothetical protein